MAKRRLSLIQPERGTSGHFCGLDCVHFCLRADTITEWSCLCLEPSRSSGGLVGCWRSVKLLASAVALRGLTGRARLAGAGFLFLGVEGTSTEPRKASHITEGRSSAGRPRGFGVRRVFESCFIRALGQVTSPPATSSTPQISNQHLLSARDWGPWASA